MPVTDVIPVCQLCKTAASSQDWEMSLLEESVLKPRVQTLILVSVGVCV